MVYNLFMVKIVEFCANLNKKSVLMRLKEEKIHSLAEKIINMLKKDERTVFFKDEQKILHAIKEVITQDLKREDALDEEVHELLSQHRDKIAWANMDYHTLFQKAKRTLIRERKLVI